jgi:hypothetical protein
MKSESRIQTVAFVGNYLPRKCGIATFTSDLLQAVAADILAAGASRCLSMISTGTISIRMSFDSRLQSKILALTGGLPTSSTPATWILSRSSTSLESSAGLSLSRRRPEYVGNVSVCVWRWQGRDLHALSTRRRIAPGPARRAGAIRRPESDCA